MIAQQTTKCAASSTLSRAQECKQPALPANGESCKQKQFTFEITSGHWLEHKHSSPVCCRSSFTCKRVCLIGYLSYSPVSIALPAIRRWRRPSFRTGIVAKCLEASSSQQAKFRDRKWCEIAKCHAEVTYNDSGDPLQPCFLQKWQRLTAGVLCFGKF